ncbi:TolC family protein [Salinispira pacifica]|nr:TolC family protein [Salinispira pacifica]
MKTRTIFLGFLSIMFLFSGLFSAASQESEGSGWNSYSRLREAWMNADLDIRLSELKLQNQERDFALANTGLDNSVELGLGGTQQKGISLERENDGDSLNFGANPYANLLLGDEHQSSASLSAQLNRSGSGSISISPRISLSHSFSDIFGADTADPEDVQQLLNLYLSRLNVMRSRLDSEISLLTSINNMWSRKLDIDAAEYQLVNLLEDRADAVNLLGYAEDSSYIADLDYQIGESRRRFEYLQLLLEQDMNSLHRNSGIMLETAVLERIVSEEFIQEALPYEADVPEPQQFTDYQTAMFELKLAERELQDFLEADETKLGLGIEAETEFSDGQTLSSQVAAGISLDVGTGLSVSLDVGYFNSNNPNPQNTPYAGVNLSWSSNSRQSSETLQYEQLQLQLEQAEYSLQSVEERLRIQSLSFENQLLDLRLQLSNIDDHLDSLAVKRDETLSSLSDGVASQNEIRDIDRSIMEIRGNRKSIQIELLILQKEMQSATVNLIDQNTTQEQ